MRRALGFIPLAPIAVASVVLGFDALVRDFVSRFGRWYAEVLDEMERNR